MKSQVAMIKKAKRRKSSRPSWSESQTARYKELVGQLEQLGFVTRREELKRGHCWRAHSGACRSLSQRFIFVDSRLNPNEQIAFLATKVGELSTETCPADEPLTHAA